jgi:TPR repeat protein
VTAPASGGDAAPPAATGDIVQELRAYEAELKRPDAALRWHADRVEKADAASRAQRVQQARDYLREYKRFVALDYGRPPDELVKAFSAMCDAGDLPACDRTAAFIKSAAINAADEAKALPYMKRACDGGYLSACYSLAVSTFDSDRASAEPLIARVCESGDGSACTWYAAALQSEPKRALPLYQKACDLGDSIGCEALGTFFKNGFGTAPDPALATKAFQRSCDLGRGVGCYELVDHLTSQKADPERIKAALVRGCTLDWAQQRCTGVIPRPAGR